MKIDWTSVAIDLDSRPITDEQGKCITLGQLAIRALLVSDERTPADEKFKRWQTARKIHENGDISVDEAALLKTAAGLVLTPLPLGLLWTAIEGK
jgi:hypothetical protein